MNRKYEANEAEIVAINNSSQNVDKEYHTWITQQEEIGALSEKINAISNLKNSSDIKTLDFTIDYADLQKSEFWFDEEFRIMQSELFIKALAARKQFLYENKKHLKMAVSIWKEQSKYISKINGKKSVQTAWEWINFAIPVISTTFASFGRMFRNLDINSLSNLFIDEAGQALPQASVGAIFRSKRVMVVGDPSQIKPVLTLDSNILNLIAENYDVTERFVSNEASTQSLVDIASQFGFQKDEDKWIGIPLWVHRRSNYPMFTISNEISYNGLMVQGKKEDEAKEKQSGLIYLVLLMINLSKRRESF
ncbi:MAG: hypothetical protein LBN09_05350 [Clostridioides sp.]|jgi:superfamily I DNA and/or RNA helicase|nr:hypothetical protein [Clostridioides sp.]